MSATMTSDAPASGLDPFSKEFLRDPYPAHEQLQEAGPVVRLERYGVWAMARHEQVHATLNDWETFRSAAGVGLADFTKEKPFRPPSLLIEADPPEHSRARRAITGVLTPKRVRSLREAFEREANILVDRVVQRGRFDAVEDFAEAFPTKVFPDAVGVPDRGRENLMAYGNMVFNAFGPRNEIFEESAKGQDEVRDWIAEMCQRENLRDGGLATAAGAAVARPDLPVLALTGDGGAMMALGELDSIIGQQLDVLVVVFNDAAYGAEVHHFEPMGRPTGMVEFGDRDFAAIAAALGARAATIRSADDLAAPVQDWLAQRGGPLVLDCKVDPRLVSERLAEAFAGGA